MKNRILLTGKLVEQLELDHIIEGENIYKGKLSVPRLSDNLDTLPFLVPARKLGACPNKLGATVSFEGQLRTHNVFNSDGSSRLLIYGFAQRPAPVLENPNQVQLTGMVYKTPTHRMTPFGRVITDLMLAIPRAHGKSDYIPCVTWGRTARFASHLKVGDCVTLIGRFQSRDYQKHLSNGTYEQRTALEVSVQQLRLVCNDTNSMQQDLRRVAHE